MYFRKEKYLCFFFCLCAFERVFMFLINRIQMVRKDSKVTSCADNDEIALTKDAHSLLSEHKMI